MMIDTIFRCSQHPVSVCQIHAASRMAFRLVLDSCRSHLLWGLHSVIFDGDRLRYWFLLPRTEWELGSQSSSPGIFRWLYGSLVLQLRCYGGHMKGMTRMLYCGAWGHSRRSYCHIPRVHHHTGIAWYRIPVSLLGSEMSGRRRCRSRLSDLEAARRMWTSCSHQWIVYAIDCLRRLV